MTAASGATAIYLWLCVGTLALHLLLASGTVVGALVCALWRGEEGWRRRLAGWLPIGLGLAITAGVAPLLFLQLLYPKAIYTADLLLWKRFAAFVPALGVAFYGLYAAKGLSMPAPWRRGLFAAVAILFFFLASTWSQQYMLSLDPSSWPEVYDKGADFLRPGSGARLLVFTGMGGASIATLAACLPSLAAGSRRFAAVGAGGGLVSGLGLFLCAPSYAGLGASGLGWAIAVCLGLTAASWLGAAMGGRAAKGATVIAMLATIASWILVLTVRESARLGVLGSSALLKAHASSLNGSAFALFAIFLAINGGLVTYFVLGVRRSLKALPASEEMT